MDLAHFAMLPTDFFVDGTGTIDPDLGEGDSFDFSAVVFNPGSNVLFHLRRRKRRRAAGRGDLDRHFARRLLRVRQRHRHRHRRRRSGHLRARARRRELRSTSLSPISPSAKTRSTSATPGISGEQRLRDFVSQVGDDVVFAAVQRRADHQFRARGHARSTISSEEDFILGGGADPEIELAGTTFDES